PRSYNCGVVQPRLQYRIREYRAKMVACRARASGFGESPLALCMVSNATSDDQHLHCVSRRLRGVHSIQASLSAPKRSTQFGKASHGKLAEAWHEYVRPTGTPSLIAARTTSALDERRNGE